MRRRPLGACTDAQMLGDLLRGMVRQAGRTPAAKAGLGRRRGRFRLGGWLFVTDDAGRVWAHSPDGDARRPPLRVLGDTPPPWTLDQEGD